MRIIVSSTRNHIGYIFCIFIEISFLACLDHSFLQSLDFFLPFLKRFFNTVCSDTRFLPIFLFIHDLFNISIFCQVLIDFNRLPFFLKLFKVPRLLTTMSRYINIKITWCRQWFLDFHMIVHVESSLCYIFCGVLHTFLLFSPFSFLNLKLGILIDLGRLILRHIPGFIETAIVVIHDSWTDSGGADLWVEHGEDV